ncbi:MAG: hypothetical protein ACP5QO_14635, partial [Clostridia bacterium]
MQTAEVVIDRVARGLDRPLSYAWPEDGRPVPLGARVRVPLGSTDAVGVVVAVDQAVDQAVALRPITTVLDREPVLPEDLIALAFWMRDRWCCLLTQALRALIPAPVRRMQAPELPGLYALGEGPPRGARRQALFERVRVEPGVGASRARADAGAGAATLRELEAAGHLRRGELALPALPPQVSAREAATAA